MNLPETTECVAAARQQAFNVNLTQAQEKYDSIN